MSRTRPGEAECLASGALQRGYMDRAADILRVAERLYGGAAAAVWSPAFEAIVAMLDADHALLVRPEGAVASAGVDDDDLARLFSAEGMRLMAPLFTRVPVGVTDRTTFLADGDFARSAAYNEVVRPMKGFHSIQVRQPGADGFMLIVCRPPQADGFENADTVALQRLVPHVATALALQRRLRLSEDTSSGLARALDRLDAGVVITDGTGDPVMLNPRAERIIAEADGLSLDATGMAAATPAATRRLREAIMAAGRDDAVDTQRIRLERSSGRLPLLVTVLPIWRLAGAVPGVGAARVALFIVEADRPPSIDPALVAETFRLTVRECEIAMLLAEGLDRASIAARLGLSVGTVREHLHRVFQKTGARSQLALATLLRGFAGPLG